MGAIPGLRVQDMNTSDLKELTGPPLRVWSSAEFKKNLDASTRSGAPASGLCNLALCR